MIQGAIPLGEANHQGHGGGVKFPRNHEHIGIRLIHIPPLTARPATRTLVLRGVLKT